MGFLKALLGTKVSPEAWKSSATSEELGELTIPSGAVMVGDAGSLMAPVKVDVAAGTWRVRVTRRRDGKNASAALYREGAAPVAWDKRGDYPVDAGMAGFFDSGLFARVEKHPWQISIYDDLICEHLDPAEAQGHAGALVPFEELKFSACASGSGDGVYPVFAGTDAGGAVVVVVTTF